MKHKLVIPYDETLLSKMKSRDIVVRTGDFNSINAIRQSVERKNRLHAIWVETGLDFTSIPFEERWADIPLALFPGGFGSFKELIAKLDLLQKLNIRVYLSTDEPNVTRNLNILSSLGIHSCLRFGKQTIDWDKINDLMHYTVFSMASHAPIDPFQYVLSHYEKDQFTYFSGVYFNNPAEYLHINEKEQIAFTSEEMDRGDFFSQGISVIDTVEENEKYNKRMNSWQEFFLQADGCAYCPSWRVCLGKFSDTRASNPGCVDFFSDLIDASYHFLDQNEKKEKIWRL